MSEENKKKLKEYQKNYREAKKLASQMQTCQEKCATNIYFFVLLLIFKEQIGVLII